MLDLKANLEKDEVIKETIIVVDDNPTNLDLLDGMLTEAGFEVRAAINGVLALSSIEKLPPDLILLDIQMPEMDGYEICGRLKANSKTQDIPVVFISALDDISDKVKGFHVGGVDYITKPFQVEEVLARINTHLTIRRLQKKQEKQNRELIEAARFREEVEHITRHDLKGPLTPIISFPKLIRRIESLSQKSVNYLRIMETAGLRMLDLINRSLDIFKMEKGIYIYTPASVDIVHIVYDVLKEMQSQLETGQISIHFLLNDAPVTETDTFEIQGEEFLCYTMLNNLIRNAIEASTKEDKITISLEDREMKVIRIHNPTEVPESIRHRFFEKFATAGKKAGTGLGTYSVMLAVKTQKGSISLQTNKNEGTTVIVHLLKTNNKVELQ